MQGGGHHEGHEDHEGLDSRPFMFFMLFMVKSGVEDAARSDYAVRATQPASRRPLYASASLVESELVEDCARPHPTIMGGARGVDSRAGGMQ